MPTVKTLIGNVKGPQGVKGDAGPQGVTGQRGSRWVTGDAITGTSTIPKVFPDTGIADALVNDQYLNKDTGIVYRCTTAGDADTAEWVYTACIKGNDGDNNIMLNMSGYELGDWGADQVITDEKNLMSVTYGAGKFVAVGVSGRLCYSLDGVTWIKGVDLGTVTLRDVAYSDEKHAFAAVGGDSVDSGVAYTSTDGIVWKSTAVETALMCVTYGSGNFLAAGANGKTYSCSDMNEPAWLRSSTTTSAFLKANDMVYGGGHFVIVTTDGTAHQSEDGISWTLATGIDSGLYGVTYGKSGFVAVGANANTYWSSDGVTWNKGYGTNTALQGSLTSVTYGRGIFVAAGTNGVNYYSTDGSEWAPNENANTGTVLRITYGAGKFVAVGMFGAANNLDCNKWYNQTIGAAVEDLRDKIDYLVLNKMWPVGSIYMSANDANPGAIIGGTWTKWGQGRVPVGVKTSDNNFNAVEKTGGESAHTLTVSEIPSHSHKQIYGTIYDPNGLTESDSRFGTHAAPSVMPDVVPSLTSSAGGGSAHNNLQPYITCYMWKRMA